MLNIKPGDVVVVQGQGYLSDFKRTYTIDRVTKRFAFSGTSKFSLDRGVLMPHDKYINHFIVLVNGEKPIRITEQE